MRPADYLLIKAKTCKRDLISGELHSALDDLYDIINTLEDVIEQDRKDDDEGGTHDKPGRSNKINFEGT